MWKNSDGRRKKRCRSRSDTFKAGYTGSSFPVRKAVWVVWEAFRRSEDLNADGAGLGDDDDDEDDPDGAAIEKI